MAAVLFDLDETLVAEREAEDAALEAVADAFEGLTAKRLAVQVRGCARTFWRSSSHYVLCRSLGLGALPALWSTSQGCHRMLESLCNWIPTYRRETWATVLRRVGVDANYADAVAQRFTESLAGGCRPLPGAIRLVQDLGSRHALGLITNGFSDTQRRKLRLIGIEERLDVVVISGEVGFGKPDPRAFRVALDSLSVAPDDVVMVGDNWSRDIDGALAAGIRAVWVSGGRPPPRSDTDGVTVVGGLSDLTAALLW